MWPKFGNSNISMREVVMTSIGFDQGCSRFMFNSLRLALGIVTKFYTSMVKELKLKLKVRMFWVLISLISSFVEVTPKNLVEKDLNAGVFL